MVTLYYILAVDETLTVRMGKKLADALQNEAQQTGLTKGEIARQALAARLGRNGGMTAVRRHFGAITGPSDLSTNKSYRQSWAKKRA
jgi:hypothetical protein